MKSGLYIVATPIGNPEDITLRALNCLKNVDVILCEDTRVTGQLLKFHGLSAALESFHEHNADEKQEKIIDWIESGKSVALVSDAGTPLISDPGYKLIRDLRDLNLYVTSLPGPCAAITALTLSGLPANRFYFYGFLPSKANARKKTLEEISAVSATFVFYENKNRIEETLEDIRSVWGDCNVALAREMTKEYEEVMRFSVNELVTRLQEGPVKGELVLLVDRNEKSSVDEEQVEPLIKQYLNKHPVKVIAQMVSDKTGVSKNKVYERVLELKKQS